MHPLVVIVFVSDGANIRAAHAERNAPTLRDANAPFVGARPVEAAQPIGRSRQGAQRLRAVQRGQDRLQPPNVRGINASAIVAAVQPLDCAPREALYRQVQYLNKACYDTADRGGRDSDSLVRKAATAKPLDATQPGLA